MRTSIVVGSLALGMVVVSAVSGCASHVLIPPDKRLVLDRNLTGRDRNKFFKLSFYVTPFFGDASKKFLTPVPPEEVRILNRPGGEPAIPGPVEAILPAGTRTTVTKVEFPTAWAMAERVPYTPRTQPWIYLEIQGQPRGIPYILVLRPQISNEQDFLTEVERYLVAEDPTARMADWPTEILEAIRSKTAITDMPASALEMAWGYPERKRIIFSDSSRTEEWRYVDNRRVAFLIDGRVTKLEGGGAKR